MFSRLNRRSVLALGIAAAGVATLSTTKTRAKVNRNSAISDWPALMEALSASAGIAGFRYETSANATMLPTIWTTQ